ncbi:MAG: efflux RND transporter periplasmic adaptor subunit [Candidatus Aminicenantes bacterium]|nr:efflux RND transporter periplasmic adaptor subunit [Candidatus Aminicenantes bacterium]
MSEILDLKSKDWPRWTLFLSLLVSIIFALWTSCQKSPSVPDEEADHEHFQAEEITLSPEAIKTGGVETQVLQTISLRPRIKVPGEIKFNPRGYYRLSSPVAGRVEQLLVFEGDRVTRGQNLVKLFSLPYLEALTELKLAYQRWQRLDELQHDEKQMAWSLVLSARNKLKLLRLEDKDIDELLRQPSEDQLYCLKSPIHGQVISRQVVTGEQVEVGTVLMDIASTDRLWAEIFIQEKDLARVTEGTEALLRVQAYPDLEFKGQVNYLGPIVDESTRLVKGRLELDNPSGLLKTGMYAEVVLLGQEIKTLAVPEEAIQEVYGRKVVFVSEQGGKFKARPVEVGEEIAGWVPMLKGLKEGEKYVSRGAFIIKSELLKSTFGEDEHHHD